MSGPVRHRIVAASVVVLAVSAGVTGAAMADPDSPPPESKGCPGCWQPELQTAWQWQLKDVPTEPFLDVGMYDIDGFEADADTVAGLHEGRADRGVVCYLSAGSWEDWRPDADRFGAELLGEPLDDWDGERWLDIRQFDGTLGEVMTDRLDMCRDKGFDAVEFDNVDGYANDSGFDLSADDQLAYNRWLADRAHERGLSAALKNDMAQIPQLLPSFDFAVNEECFANRECTTDDNGEYGYDQFIAAGKAVFQVEYTLDVNGFCPRANALNFNSLKKNLDLDAAREACRGG